MDPTATDPPDMDEVGAGQQPLDPRPLRAQAGSTGTSLTGRMWMADDSGMELDAFIGEWSIEAGFPGAPEGTTTFEWILGGKFMLQRSEVPVPEAPDGVMIIGFDEGRETYLQHYFDSRGVARVYEMSLDGNVWTLSRTAPDFAPLDFSQRYVGTFSDDGRIIEGAWEINHDGTTWEKDFDLRYRKR